MNSKSSLVTTIILLLVILFPATAHSQGLKAEYFHGINFDYHILTRIDSKIDFSRRLRSPAPDVRPQFFSIRWSGSIHAPRTGLYTFHVLADDGIRIWINKQLIIDAWVDQEATRYSGSIMLEAGSNYDIKVEYYNTIIHSVAKLSWELPPETYEHFGQQVQVRNVIATIPSKYLLPDEGNVQKEGILLVSSDQMPIRSKAEKSEDDVIAIKKSQGQQARVVPVSSYVANKPIVLRSVEFRQGSYELSTEAFRELDKLSEYLKTNPAFQISINGYTDYIGDSLDNQILSENRALAVATYLEKSGVDPKRISSRGFGGSKPLVVKANTDRVQNRRVEFVLTQENSASAR